MANDLTGSPYKIDTAGVITTDKIFVNQMVWQEPAAAEDDLVVSDANARTLWDENAYIGGNGVSIEQDINHFCDGITVDTIDSGILFIYFR
jgi:hypothetical protein